MKKISITFVFVCSFISLFACTTFFLRKGDQFVFGRNYDWIVGSGVINSNLRGLHKIAGLGATEKPAAWTSLYGSITFNQYGKEFPTGGMNEKGLVVELMWLDDTKYPSSDNRGSMGCLEWIQYQLDRSATINDVIASDSFIRIKTKATPIHFLVADANGNAATFEFLNGKMKYHKGNDLPVPVLTNNTYESSMKFARPQMEKNNTEVNSFRDNSLGRFVHACAMVEKYNADNITVPLVDYSFRILDEVAQGDFTKWSIVYDIKNLKVYFKTSVFKEVRTFDLSTFDFSCKSTPLSYELGGTKPGNIREQFVPYTTALNLASITQAFSVANEHVYATKEEIEKMAKYPESIKCQ